MDPWFPYLPNKEPQGLCDWLLLSRRQEQHRLRPDILVKPLWCHSLGAPPTFPNKNRQFRIKVDVCRDAALGRTSSTTSIAGSSMTRCRHTLFAPNAWSAEISEALLVLYNAYRSATWPKAPLWGHPAPLAIPHNLQIPWTVPGLRWLVHTRELSRLLSLRGKWAEDVQAGAGGSTRDSTLAYHLLVSKSATLIGEALPTHVRAAGCDEWRMARCVGEEASTWSFLSKISIVHRKGSSGGLRLHVRKEKRKSALADRTTVAVAVTCYW